MISHHLMKMQMIASNPAKESFLVYKASCPTPAGVLSAVRMDKLKTYPYRKP